MTSIGDFAESLILGQVEDIQKGKSLPPKLEEAKATANAPAKDISTIEVPKEMMRSILGEGYEPEEQAPSDGFPELVWDDPYAEEPQPEPTVLTEETAKELVSLLEDVRGIVSEIKEMTSAGMLGVNLGGPVADPMKGSSKSYRKPTKVAKRKNALKEAIKNRLR